MHASTLHFARIVSGNMAYKYRLHNSYMIEAARAKNSRMRTWPPPRRRHGRHIREEAFMNLFHESAARARLLFL